MVHKWQIAKKISTEWQNKFPEINPLILQLLNNRGLTSQQAVDEFLHPDYGQDIHDPYLFRDMSKAVERIFLAIERNEKITVHGDYDADGVSATVVMVSTLRALGAKQVEVYIPHRVTEGYGLSVNTVKELAKNGTQLVVTVDCGITSQQEIKLAGEKGIDVIISDHHEQQPVLPEAYAIINPHVEQESYPFKNLSGTGVAFKVAQALLKKDAGQAVKDGFEKWLLDLVAIGTIGDCMSILGENRTLVKYGLLVLRKTRRLGISELVKGARLILENLDTSSVSFSIVPRLNAAGRLDHANTAYELLITANQEEASEIAATLEKTNQERQRVTEKMLAEAKKQIGQVTGQKILFAVGPDWSPGIVGLVAGRLADEYARPVLIMGEKKDEIVGSGRSISEFDITRALIESRELLDRFGGHAAACGFTLKKSVLKKFIARLTDLADKKIKKEHMIKRLTIDAAVKLEEIDWSLVNELEAFEPFGAGNEQPTFLASGLEIVDLKKIGLDGKHLRLAVKQGSTSRKIIAFGFGKSWGQKLKVGDKVDAVFECSTNEWNGNKELQLKLMDIKLSK